MEELLTAALLADAQVVALVGGEGAARIYWERRPTADAIPSIVLHALPSAGADYAQAGRTQLTAYEVQLDCWAGSMAAALELRRAVERTAGPLGSLRAPPLQVLVSRHHAGSDRAQGPNADSSTDLYRASLDLDAWHTATP